MPFLSGLKTLFDRAHGWMETHEPPFTPPSFDSRWVVGLALAALMLAGIAIETLPRDAERPVPPAPDTTVNHRP